MKKRVVLCIILLVSLFIGSVKVNALDPNKYTISALAVTGNAGAELELKVEEDFGDNSLYVMFMKDSSSKPTNVPSNNSEMSGSNVDYADITKWKSVNANDGGKINIYPDWYMLDGYNYAYFLECDSSTCKLSDKAFEVKKPDLPELGQRYKVIFSNSEKQLNVYPYFPKTGENGSHKIIVKIGKINDNNVVYQVYKNNSLSALLEYAKTAEGITTSFSDEKTDYISFEELNIENGAYYYVYTTYENTDGMYRDLSDVTIAMGKDNYLINDVKYNFDDKDVGTSVNVKNPSTMDTNVALVLILTIVFAALIIFGIKKIKSK